MKLKNMVLQLGFKVNINVCFTLKMLEVKPTSSHP